jgi:hypothetical protein
MSVAYLTKEAKLILGAIPFNDEVSSKDIQNDLSKRGHDMTKSKIGHTITNQLLGAFVTRTKPLKYKNSHRYRKIRDIQ